MTTIIDVSGSRGADGLNGNHAVIYRSFDGNHGSDATNPTKGGDAGDGGNGGIGGDVAFILGDGEMGCPGLDATLGGTITLHMDDTDSGLLVLFVIAWTPRISYCLDVYGGRGGNITISFTILQIATKTMCNNTANYPNIGNAGRHGTPGTAYTVIIFSSGGPGGPGGDCYADTTGGRDCSGSPGPDGESGLRPSFTLYDSKPGKDGILRFLIKNR
ncbi:16582_t:CDS:2 [Racocetra fulgida]|uniref:16582_t:CDS:1 n=1 Tax=Racocetra fulgida TaxID=60492 RepID=A0A9N9EK44_9GLOM|nr:16582_t:CDS:2 [Racocetra fulgida]